MSMHGKFMGRVLKTEKERVNKYEFTTVSIELDGPNDVVGVKEVQAVLDPGNPVEWKDGDLVELEGDVIKIGICKCCGAPLPVVDAMKCSKVFS